MPCTHKRVQPGCASCAAKLLGAAGGAAGTGEAKARGGSAYYRALVKRRWASRKVKA